MALLAGIAWERERERGSFYKHFFVRHEDHMYLLFWAYIIVLSKSSLSDKLDRFKKMIFFYTQPKKIESGTLDRFKIYIFLFFSVWP